MIFVMDGDTMDILNYFPSTLLDLIFQHLSGKEIISTTLVSPNWNEFLSNSSLTAWKDIVIQPKISDDIGALVNSNRRFEHLRAVNITAILPELMKIVKKPGRKWRTISIFRQNFTEESQLSEILATAAKTIEKLDLHTLYRQKESEVQLPEPAAYPALKLLRITYHKLDESIPWVNKFFKSAPQLESLYVTNGCDVNIRNLILSSRNLKKLTISGRFQDNTFFYELSQNLPSQLEEFEFNEILSSSESDFNLSYFNTFFKSQSKTLKRFETDALLELDEFETAFAMPNLETLNIKSFHYNREIIDSYLDGVRGSSDINAASLKNFSVHHMDQKLLELLAVYARNLEYLKVNELLATDASNPTWFPKLEKVQVFFMIEELESLIIAKSEDERSHLEKLIMAGVVQFDIAIHLSQEEIAREILGAIDA